MNRNSIEVTTTTDFIGLVTRTWKPTSYCPETGDLLVENWDGSEVIVTNSNFSASEWIRLQNSIQEATGPLVSTYNRFAESNLIDTNVSFIEDVRSWSTAGRRVSASVSMTGKATVLDDIPLTDYGIPIPVIRVDYNFPARQFQKAQALRTGFDTSLARAHARSVSEAREKMFYDGFEVVVQGQRVWGFRNHPMAFRGSPDVFGGNVFTSIEVVHPTFIAIITRLREKFFRGPFGVSVGHKVYEIFQQRFEDGSGDTVLDQLERMKEIKWIEATDWLDPDEMVFVQLDRNCVEVLEASKIDNRKYGSPDEVSYNFMIYCVVSLKISPDYKKNIGVAHVTKCLG